MNFFLQTLAYFLRILEFPGLSLSPDLIIDLVNGQQGAQMGEPYKTIGLISESNKVVRALNDNFDLMTERLSPKKSTHGFSFKILLSRFHIT